MSPRSGGPGQEAPRPRVWGFRLTLGRSGCQASATHPRGSPEAPAMEAGAGLCQRRPPPVHPRPRLFPPPPLPSPVPGGPTHLVHRLRLETIWKFTHKMKPRLVLAQRFLGRKNNNKQTKKSPFQTSQEQTGALPSSHSVTPRFSWGLSVAATPCS